MSRREFHKVSRSIDSSIMAIECCQENVNALLGNTREDHCRRSLMRKIILSILLVPGALATCAAQTAPPSCSWVSVLRDSTGKPVAGATVVLNVIPAPPQVTQKARSEATSNSSGVFTFPNLPPGSYTLTVHWNGREVRLESSLQFPAGDRLHAWISLTANERQIELHPGDGPVITANPGTDQATKGENLNNKQVSNLPLNQRDFSKLLTLAAGTTTDTNGAANFTQQFAINGQRGTTAVFAMDGVDTTDPELGGATFTNFNVDAIQEIRSDSGVMAATIGEGAAGFTDVITESGTAQVHGDGFEFLRNSALDARNFFDRSNLANPGRIPPFRRNEFGFTNGGPLVIPGVYDGRQRTFYFGQYQGFRQVLGTTQVLSVPAPSERMGIDATAFPGDTLIVPVNPAITPALDGYPLPNDSQGAFGARTYATSSKVTTVSDQFSVRIDHKISDKAQLFARFNLDNTRGPQTNPGQTAIDPSFGITFLDHQRSAGLRYTRTLSPRMVLETTLGYLRSTPLFVPQNSVQPALQFGDGLYEPFNGSGGTITGTYSNLYQIRQTLAYALGKHGLQAGVEARFNRDTLILGTLLNGQYIFGGGTAYSPVEIASASGTHNIHPGDPLPDSLAGFLTATPYSFTISVAPPLFPQGEHMGDSAKRRKAYNFYIQDTWQVTPRFTATYGLRYELSSRIGEAHDNTGNLRIVSPGGQPTTYWDPAAQGVYLINLHPPYQMDWDGFGPRASLAWHARDHTTLRAAGAITTLLVNLYQNDYVTASFPGIFVPWLSALPGAPVPFQNSVTSFNLPPFYTPSGQLVFATSRTTDVPPNTAIDVQRFQDDLAATTPGHQVAAVATGGMTPNYRNGYIATYSAGFDHTFGEVTFSANYVATAGVKLSSAIYPNGYVGADPAVARFTQFDAKGHVMGGYGLLGFMSSRSHSTFHSLQTSLSKSSARYGLGFSVNYTYSKSLDDTSSIFGASPTVQTGNVQLAPPQDPFNPGADKGPSTFDVTHNLAFNIIQVLPFDRVNFLRFLGSRVTSGWQLVNISTLTSGLPFSIYSGIQQTGYGSYGVDRPDQVGKPLLSTSRAVREDYFGQGQANRSFFAIPIGIPGGTGPNQGRLGTLGRDTFRGPAFHDFDLALIKDTTFGHRAGTEAVTLQFRAEFFNAFNLVNFGLPSNVVLGSGFGVINRTAGNSRQLQFSLKLLY